MAKSLIEVWSVTKWFQRDEHYLTALEDVSLTISEGEFFVILGPSGCGKTTLLKIIGGLMTASEGEVQIAGERVEGPNLNCGFVFQEFNLLPWRSVLANVEFALEARGFPPRERRKVAQRWIELVGLAGFESHYPAELSGGMRQRVGLARALGIDPTILLMDEPFGALDAQTREILQRELLRLWNREKKTVAFVTHDVDEAIYLADRIVVMSPRPGRVIDEVCVEIERPRWKRKREIVTSQIFAHLKIQLWDMLGLD